MPDPSDIETVREAGSLIRGATTLDTALNWAKPVATTIGEIAPKALGAAKFLAQEAPAIAAGVTVVTTAVEAGKAFYDGRNAAAKGALIAFVPEAVGNVVGFGLGDALRAVTQEITTASLGPEYASEKSKGREMFENAAKMLGDFMDSAPRPSNAAATPAPAAGIAPPPLPPPAP